LRTLRKTSYKEDKMGKGENQPKVSIDLIVAISSILSKQGLDVAKTPFIFGGTNVFFSDPTKTVDTLDGLAPSTAKQWTNSAIALCTDLKSGVVLRCPGDENIDDDDADPAIVCNRNGVKVIGVIGGGNPDQASEVSTSIRRRQNAGWGAATGPAITVEEPCTLANLEMVAVGQNAIYFDGDGGGVNGGFSHVFQCRFVGWGLMTEAIRLWAGAYNKIEQCRFEEMTTGIMFDSTPGNNADFNEIKDCIFQGCTIPIDTDAGSNPHNTIVRGCKFMPSNAAPVMTFAIRTLGAWDQGEISGNTFGCTRAEAYDIGISALRALNVRVFGNTYTDGTDETLDGGEHVLQVVSDILAANVDLITITGGPVLAEIYAYVSGTIGGGPVTCTLQETTDVPAATIALSDAGNIAGAVEGSTIHYTNADPGITTIDADGAYSANPRCQVVLTPGTLTANYSADETGEITWFVRYWPLSPNSSVVLA